MENLGSLKTTKIPHVYNVYNQSTVQSYNNKNK